MLAYSTTNTREDGPIGPNPTDHDDFGLIQSKVMNVIDVDSLELDAGEKAGTTFSRPALGTRPIFPVDVTLSGLKGATLQRHSKLATDKMGLASTATLIVHRP
ncbi:MAG: hypothetical protein HKN11_09580 [Rhizobiales bacterium]|nr:hypothetical protein [Hyphomicrobiales bacterium]